MKKTFFAMIIALLAVATMSAQPQGRQHHPKDGMNPEKMIEHRVAMLDKALSLTPDQKTAITALYTEQSQKMRAEMQQMRADKQGKEQPKPEDMQARREAMKAEQEAVDAKVAALLTDEQKVKFEEIKAKQNERGPRNRDGGPSHHKMKRDGKAPQAKQDCCKGEAKAEKAECQNDCCKDKAEAKTK